MRNHPFVIGCAYATLMIICLVGFFACWISLSVVGSTILQWTFEMSKKDSVDWTMPIGFVITLIITFGCINTFVENNKDSV